jgi:hypothetical protein
MTTNPLKPVDIRFFLLFIPAAYCSYLFHEFGHWTVGEILGNRMAYSLNYVWPISGSFIKPGHELYSSIGGPGFSILQAALAWIVIEKLHTLYAYPFAFFPMFSRFFSVLLGGFEKQDEAKIASLMGIGTYTAAVIVLIVLLAIVIRCSHILRLDLKTNGYIVTASTLCQLLVIGTYEFLKI